jgi:hypothetical protein
VEIIPNNSDLIETTHKENGVNDIHNVVGEKDSKGRDRATRQDGLPSAFGVSGFISLGTRLQAILLRERLARLNESEPVLVYGTCLEAYSAVQGTSITSHPYSTTSN